MKDSELSAFLSAERSLGEADDQGRADVLAHLESTLGLPPGGGDGGGSGGGSGGGGSGGGAGAGSAGSAALRGAGAMGAAKVAGLLLFGFVAGTVTHAAVTRGAAPAPALVSQATTVPVASAVTAPSASDALPLPFEPPTMAASDLPDAPPPAPAAAARAPEERRSGDLDSERTLLETARTALVRGDSAHALEALERHRARFPGGQLREERESLTVYALVAANRKDEAQARAAAFHRAFPRSLQGPALDALVGAAP